MYTNDDLVARFHLEDGTLIIPNPWILGGIIPVANEEFVRLASDACQDAMDSNPEPAVESLTDPSSGEAE